MALLFREIGTHNLGPSNTLGPRHNVGRFQVSM